jgi:hypothetical protein
MRVMRLMPRSVRVVFITPPAALLDPELSALLFRGLTLGGGGTIPESAPQRAFVFPESDLAAFAEHRHPFHSLRASLCERRPLLLPRQRNLVHIVQRTRRFVLPRLKLLMVSSS